LGRGEVRQAAGNTQGILARAFAAHQVGNIPEAEFLYKLVLQADKRQFDALHMLAVIEGQRGNIPAALNRIREAIRLRPKSVDALINLGRIQGELGDHDSAVATYQKALALDPQSALGHSNLSIVLRKQGQYDAALQHCDAALRIAPNYADAWSNRGNVFFALKRLDDALVDYDKAAALQPNHGIAHFNRGNALGELRRYDEALAPFRRAISINANHAEAWQCLGKMFFELGRHQDASEAYGRALALRPDLAAAWLGRGNILFDLRRPEEAFVAFDKALELDPELPYAEGHRLHAKLQTCDWTHLDREVSRLLARLRDGKPVSVAFPLLAIPSSPADQLQAARRYVSDLPRFAPFSDGRVYAHDRIRVAYVSSDFRDHAVGYLTVGLFEHHDRSRFEVTAIGFGPDTDSDFRRRIKASFDRFVDISSWSDQAVADLIRQLEIDIAVDLNGFTRSGRLGVFTRRAAPIQVNYLGYAGTMGSEYYDYVLADQVVIPRANFEFYDEKVVWLPDAFLVTSGGQAVAERTPSRSELGLPDSGFVFCAFNQSHKIDTAIFDVWMRLLQAIDGSVLWLKPDNTTAEHNLRLEAGRRGVAPARLIFAPPVARIDDHLARQRQADLFLDTLYYNAHTTAVDALWVGLPVITCPGSTFASRVAASLLRAVGLPELVAESLADYESLAFKLALDPVLLGNVKAKLARNRLNFPLFDIVRFTRNIERAYTMMCDRSRREEPPQSFAVDAG
jgi:protein O-GlcNAc transferase